VALAVILLVLLLSRVGADVPRALAVSAAVVAGGMTAARLWYVTLQRGEVAGLWARGLCIQGTIAGGALVAVPALLLAGIAVGTFFDATAPGLFYAMAVGRQGCFLAGCCTGCPDRVPVRHLVIRRPGRNPAHPGAAVCGAGELAAGNRRAAGVPGARPRGGRHGVRRDAVRSPAVTDP
jgi:prolipoprotein diacylglyceryltransferase